jgi:hypothetical protein
MPSASFKSSEAMTSGTYNFTLVDFFLDFSERVAIANNATNPISLLSPNMIEVHTDRVKILMAVSARSIRLNLVRVSLALGPTLLLVCLGASLVDLAISEVMIAL